MRRPTTSRRGRTQAMPVILLAVLGLMAVGDRAAAGAAAGGASLASAPRNGDTRDDPASRTGFLVYFAPLRIWVDPDVFWYRWADEQKAFLWNGGRELPAGGEVQDGHMFIIETDDGPCLLVRRGGVWRKAGAVFGWSERLRRYGGCATLNLPAAAAAG